MGLLLGQGCYRGRADLGWGCLVWRKAVSGREYFGVGAVLGWEYFGGGAVLVWEYFGGGAILGQVYFCGRAILGLFSGRLSIFAAGLFWGGASLEAGLLLLQGCFGVSIIWV